MTKRLDPDIKAMRAINRALSDLPDDSAVRRVLTWTVARAAGATHYGLPNVSWERNTGDRPE